MKPREFMDLTDEEVVKITTDVLSERFSNITIRNIQRDFDDEEIMVKVTINDKKNPKMIISMITNVTLYKPLGFPCFQDGGIYLSDSGFLSEEQEFAAKAKYHQFLFAALYRDFIQDNPYVKHEEQQNSKEIHVDFTITERTEPFTLQEVWDFIDDTMIREQDAHELKERIISLLQTEREHCGDYQQAELELE